MRYTTMRSLNQTLVGGKEDIPKVWRDSQATISSLLKLWIVSTCLFAYLKSLPEAKLEDDLREVWFVVPKLQLLLWFGSACAVLKSS